MSKFLTELKRDNFEEAMFTYNRIEYAFSGWWLLEWEENGEEKDMTFDTKEEFLAATVFDGQTIEEIADRITDYNVYLKPGAYG